MARKYGRRRDSGTLTSRRRLDPGTSRSLEVLQEAEQFHESLQTPALFWKEEFGPHPFLEPKEQFVEATSQSWRPKPRSENIFEEDIQEQLRNSYLIALSVRLFESLPPARKQYTLAPKLKHQAKAEDDE
ncbi:hypothetical protein TW65_05278 [Stemphylium lycopersici]|nr:hypothetical protein TW65_05278 [Stemphylium lycopersici]